MWISGLAKHRIGSFEVSPIDSGHASRGALQSDQPPSRGNGQIISPDPVRLPLFSTRNNQLFYLDLEPLLSLAITSKSPSLSAISLPCPPGADLKLPQTSLEGKPPR